MSEFLARSAVSISETLWRVASFPIIVDGSWRLTFFDASGERAEPFVLVFSRQHPDARRLGSLPVGEIVEFGTRQTSVTESDDQTGYLRLKSLRFGEL